MINGWRLSEVVGEDGLWIKIVAVADGRDDVVLDALILRTEKDG